MERKISCDGISNRPSVEITKRTISQRVSYGQFQKHSAVEIVVLQSNRLPTFHTYYCDINNLGKTLNPAIYVLGRGYSHVV